MKLGLSSVDYRIVLPGYVAAWGIAMLPIHVMPFLVTSLIDGLKLTKAEAGLLVSLELGFIGIVALAMAPIMGRIPRRDAALLACAVVLAANALSLFWNGGALVALRAVSGAGCGALLAIGNATFASSPNPARAYGQATFLNVAVNVAVFHSLPSIIQHHGHRSVYWLTIVIVLAMFPALFLLPKRTAIAQTVRATGSASIAQWMGVAAIAGVLLYCTRDTLVWAFAQESGRRAGLSDGQIGTTFAVHSVVGLLGPLAASIMGVRYGRVLPLTVGLIGTGLITTILSQTVPPPVYVALILPWTGLHLFTLSYLMGMAGEIDRSGRVISAAGGAILVADAIAPAMAGVVIDRGGYLLLGVVVAIGVVMTMAVALVLAKRLDRGGGADAGSPSPVPRAGTAV